MSIGASYIQPPRPDQISIRLNGGVHVDGSWMSHQSGCSVTSKEIANWPHHARGLELTIIELLP